MDPPTPSAAVVKQLITRPGGSAIARRSGQRSDSSPNEYLRRVFALPGTYMRGSDRSLQSPLASA